MPRGKKAVQSQPTDEEIIAQNPGASPYELLQLGLSQEKYNELVKLHEKAVPQPVKEPVKPTNKLVPEKVTTKVVAQPQTRQFSTPKTGQAWLIGPDGKRTSMSRVHAERFAKKNKGFTVQ